jgi:hypothetical protein
MKPTSIQIDSMKLWLSECAVRVEHGLPMPALPASLAADAEGGMDFSEVYVNFGSDDCYQMDFTFKAKRTLAKSKSA